MKILKLTAKDLAAQRAERWLFQALNLELSSGELLQILGPNGVGKSTLLKILAGLALPNLGSLSWGEHILNHQAHLAYLGHRLGLKLNLSVIENLKFSLNAHTLLPQVLTDLNLILHEHTLVGKLSQGQKQRVALARVCLSGKKIWILDEPFAALDQQGFELFQKLLQAHLQQGGIIILSSHRSLDFVQGVKTLHLRKNDA